MARLEFGRLSEAWAGEAEDFTPLLTEQLDAVGEAIGVALTEVGKSEVPISGGRRIDIVAQGEGGSEFVIENQYGRADHDHLTRGLAYAVARRARGLVVIAEEHRDEFRAAAAYLNDLAEHDAERGIAVWLIEARAVRIDGGPWAPLFDAVVEPNSFTATVEKTKQAERLGSIEEFWEQFDDPDTLSAAQQVVSRWIDAGYRTRLAHNHVVLEAPGPSTGGVRTVVAVYATGQVMVPFFSYAGSKTGIPIDALTTTDFRTRADTLFGLTGSERLARTVEGWLTPDRTEGLTQFCIEVADAYQHALDDLASAESQH